MIEWITTMYKDLDKHSIYFIMNLNDNLGRKILLILSRTWEMWRLRENLACLTQGHRTDKWQNWALNLKLSNFNVLCTFSVLLLLLLFICLGEMPFPGLNFICNFRFLYKIISGFISWWALQDLCSIISFVPLSQISTWPMSNLRQREVTDLFKSSRWLIVAPEPEPKFLVFISNVFNI